MWRRSSWRNCLEQQQQRWYVDGCSPSPCPPTERRARSEQESRHDRDRHHTARAVPLGTIHQTKGVFSVVKCPDARQIAYDISLGRNYGTKREKLQHRIPGRRSRTGDILVAATIILYGLTIVTEDKGVTPGEAAR